MSDRKPREYALWPCEHGGLVVEPYRVPPGHACATCGAHPVNVREVLDPWEDLAAAFERADDVRLLARIHVGSHEQGHGITANQAAAVVRALRGAGEQP